MARTVLEARGRADERWLLLVTQLAVRCNLGPHEVIGRIEALAR